MKLPMALEPCPLYDISDINGMSGIYFIVRDGQVEYVGQAKNVFARLQGHRDKHAAGLCGIYFLYWPYNCPLFSKVEGAFIRALRPRLNGNFSDGKKVGPRVTDEEFKEVLSKIGYDSNTIEELKKRDTPLRREFFAGETVKLVRFR